MSEKKFEANGQILDADGLAFLAAAVKALQNLPDQKGSDTDLYLGEIPIEDGHGVQVAVLSNVEFGYWVAQFGDDKS